MRHAILLSLMLISLGLAQTTQPTTEPTKADRTTVIGTCMLYDQTIESLGVEKGADFYFCKTPFQRRCVRAELEMYVAINKLVRIVKEKHGPDAAARIRTSCHDNDDYADAIVSEDGDAAAMQRHLDSLALPFVRKDGKWYISMPDWEEMRTHQRLADDRIEHEEWADRVNEVIAAVESGNIKTVDEIAENLARQFPD